MLAVADTFLIQAFRKYKKKYKKSKFPNIDTLSNLLKRKTWFFYVTELLLIGIVVIFYKGLIHAMYLHVLIYKHFITIFTLTILFQNEVEMEDLRFA